MLPEMELRLIVTDTKWALQNARRSLTSKGEVLKFVVVMIFITRFLF